MSHYGRRKNMLRYWVTLTQDSINRQTARIKKQDKTLDKIVWMDLRAYHVLTHPSPFDLWSLFQMPSCAQESMFCLCPWCWTHFSEDQQVEVSQTYLCSLCSSPLPKQSNAQKLSEHLAWGAEIIAARWLTKNKWAVCLLEAKFSAVRVCPVQLLNRNAVLVSSLFRDS